MMLAGDGLPMIHEMRLAAPDRHAIEPAQAPWSARRTSETGGADRRCAHPLAARVSTVWGVGQVESEKTLSPIQAAMDNEMIGMVRRFMRGLRVTPETLAMKEARRAGIAGSSSASRGATLP